MLYWEFCRVFHLIFVNCLTYYHSFNWLCVDCLHRQFHCFVVLMKKFESVVIYIIMHFWYLWNSFHGPRLVLHSHYFSDYLNYRKCFTMFYGIWITFIVIIISVFLLTQCLYFFFLSFSIFCSIYLLLSVLLLEITSFLCLIYLFFANCVSENFVHHKIALLKK